MPSQMSALESSLGKSLLPPIAQGRGALWLLSKLDDDWFSTLGPLLWMVFLTVIVLGAAAYSGWLPWIVGVWQPGHQMNGGFSANLFSLLTKLIGWSGTGAVSLCLPPMAQSSVWWRSLGAILCIQCFCSFQLCHVGARGSCLPHLGVGMSRGHVSEKPCGKKGV